MECLYLTHIFYRSVIKITWILRYNCMRGFGKLTSGFVQSRLANVPDPLDHVVVTVVQFGFKYFQVTYFEPGWSEWHLNIEYQ